MESSASESSIASPSEHIETVQSAHLPGNNAVVQDQVRSLPCDDSHHAHANRAVQYPNTVPIPEFLRAFPPRISRAEQRQFQQSSHSALLGIRCEFHSSAHDWNNSSHQASHAVPLFSERNSVPVQSVTNRIGSSSAPLMNRANHSPAECIDRAYSAQTQENSMTGRDLLSSLQAETLNHIHANQRAESLRAMPFPELPQTSLLRRPRAQQNNLPHSPGSGPPAKHREYNPWRRERNDGGPLFSSSNVAAGQSVPLHGGSSTAPEANRGEHVPLGWVYTAPVLDVQSHQHTLARRPGFPNSARPISYSNNRFYPPKNTASKNRN